jgi:hypothetical protein
MELLRSQPQQGQHGRMEVIGVDSILDAIESDVVGSADHFAPFDPAPASKVSTWLDRLKGKEEYCQRTAKHWHEVMFENLAGTWYVARLGAHQILLVDHDV